ncbi:MAG: hypothetical protein JOY58_03685 [Solirubrobacterales bacterium]|nr:hypothetical protein [Solirubrobacterales bacterium]
MRKLSGAGGGEECRCNVAAGHGFMPEVILVIEMSEIVDFLERGLARSTISERRSRSPRSL